MNKKADKKINMQSNPKPALKLILQIAIFGIIFSAVAITVAAAAFCYITQKQLDTVVIKASQAGEPVTLHDLRTQNSQAVTGQDAAQYYSIVFQNLAQINPQNLANALTNSIKVCQQSLTSSQTVELPAQIKEQIALIIKDFQPILQTLDKAAQLPLSVFELDTQQTENIGKKNAGIAQIAVYLSALRTLELIRTGQSDAAANSAVTTCRIIRVFDTYPTTFIQTVKLLSLSIALGNAQILLKYGDASEPMLEKLQEALSEIITPDTLERTFQAERAFQIETAANLFSKKAASKFLQNKAADFSTRLSPSSVFWRRARIRQRVNRHFKDLTWLVNTASQPWPKSMDKIMNEISDSEMKPGKFISKGAKFAQLARGALTTTNFTTIAIAIHRYQRKHNQLPESLDNLIDTCIDSIPIDPFTGNNMLYSQDGEGFAVYSIGPNLKDDGGVTQSPTPQQPPLDWGLRIKLNQKN